MQSPDRYTIVYASLVLFALALIGKAGYEQLYRGHYWTGKAQQEHYALSDLPAPRGVIEDASGNVLVESRPLVRLGIAPREVSNPAALASAMRRANITQRWITEATDRRRRWVDIPDLFARSEVQHVVTQRGVYPKPAMDRVYAQSAGIRGIVGQVDPAGKPLGGIELALDEVLRGDTNHVRVARDKTGHALDASLDASEPQPGSTVVLTINRALQDICERELTAAVDSLRADGGDIVVMNPHTGDVLAMASKRTDPRAVANTAVTEPYEPGSTVKPFVAAKLLGLGLAKPDEVINTFGGHLERDGSKINDAEEHQAMMTLADVIKHSSNVGIVLFSDRLTPRDKYELFRDVGFGTPTAIQLPAESPGVLKEPMKWRTQASASIVMGYGLSVTPLQVVTAYSAIANGGELLEPHIVKEVRSPSGEVQYAERRRVVRRVMSPDVSAEIRRMLREVVSGGTSTKADLATIDVAGKSGTARRAVHKHYDGSYTASFVGLFPADNPQFVILVKLDNPQNGYYGGILAGGVTNVVLRAALSARDAALDLNRLASSFHALRPDTSAAAIAALRAKTIADSIHAANTPPTPHVVATVPPDSDPRTSASYVIKLPFVAHIAPLVGSLRPVPDVTGLPLRAAARTLHAAGFRVEIIHGPTIQTFPAAGTLWMPGRVVKVSITP